MAKSAHPYILTLYRDKIALCSPVSVQPLQLQLSPASLKDLEVVNQSELENQVKAFAAASKLHPGEIIFVLSNQVVFEKDLAKIPQTEKPTHIQNFLDSIPVSSLAHKVFRIQNTEKAIAINANLYSGLKQAFEKLGFAVSAVIPGALLGDIGAQDSTTAESCRIISKKIDFIRANSFLAPEDRGFQQKRQKFLHQNRATVIILVFISIIFAGITVYLTVLRPPSRRPKPTLTPTPIPTAHYSQPTPLPTSPQQEASPSALTVQILNASGKAGLAATMQKQLGELGFVQIQTGNSPSVSPQSIVVFSSKITPVLRQSVLQLIGISSARENPAAVYDIVVTIGRQTETTP